MSERLEEYTDAEWRGLLACFNPHTMMIEVPPRRRRRKPRIAAPDGLRTPREAAAKLGCSTKTLKGHVASGALRYVVTGHGRHRPRRMFTDADLDAFIANQTRKDSPCPSTKIRARHTTSSTSGGEVIAFTARPNAQLSAKRKP